MALRGESPDPIIKMEFYYLSVMTILEHFSRLDVASKDHEGVETHLGVGEADTHTMATQLTGVKGQDLAVR